VEVEVVVEELLLGWDQVQDLLPFFRASPALVSLAVDYLSRTRFGVLC